MYIKNQTKSDSEQISEIIKMKMDPLPDFDLKIVKEDGKNFIVLSVKAGDETPYYYTGDGNRIAFTRIGNESVPVDDIGLKRLVLKGCKTTFDSLSSKYPFSDFAFTKLHAVYKQKTGLDFLDSDFVSFGLVDERGYLTNAGALFADESPIRQSRVFCTRWNGLDKAGGITDAIDDKEYSGSLISLLLDGEKFVLNNTKKQWKKTGHERVEMPEYPEQAVHECFVNALIHRDYLELGSEVHIDIFDDRLEIYSPGGMPDGSLVQDIDVKNVSSKRRNPVIADLFSRMHFMERRGSGFKKIFDFYSREVNYKPELQPTFYSNASTFIVRLFNLNYEQVGGDSGIESGIDSGIESGIDNNLLVLNVIKSNKYITIAEIAEITKISLRSVGRIVKNLKSKHIITRYGTKNGYWEVSDK